MCDVLAGELNEASAAYYVITDNESEEDENEPSNFRQ